MQHYRAALVFYADPSTYQYARTTQDVAVMQDRGQQAREALGEATESKEGETIETT